MILPFSKVGVGENFTFLNKYIPLCNVNNKISAKRFVDTVTGKVHYTSDTTLACWVDNSCACIYPQQLTFDNLSVGDIFQFGSTWYKDADIEHKYVKLCNMYYTNFYSDNKYRISSADNAVCTPDNVQSAQ